MITPAALGFVVSQWRRHAARDLARRIGLGLAISVGAAAAHGADLRLVGNFGYTTQTSGTTAVITADRLENRSAGGISGTIQLELWAFPSRYTGAPISGYRMATYSPGQLEGARALTGISSGSVAMALPPTGTWFVTLFVMEFVSATTGYVQRDFANVLEPLVTGGLPQPATLTVTSGNDSGPGTLRQAILSASAAGDTIVFAAGISTINLTSGELAIGKNLTIVGPGANVLSVQRAAATSFRIFHVNAAGATVSISGLKIADGATPLSENGGGIRNLGSLSLTSCTISGHVARNTLGANLNGGYAAGIDNLGLMTIAGSTISGNTAIYYAGGIRNSGRMTLLNSTISGNSCGSAGGGDGGGVLNNGTLTLTNCTVAGNTASARGGSGRGGGVFNTSSATAKNTIIALNGTTDVFGPFTSDNFNLIGDNTGATFTPAQPGDKIGTATSPIDPRLGPLQDNGGRTFTRALLPGSPAVDAGDDSVLAPPLSLSGDQRGAAYSRKLGVRVDIGAFEFGEAVANSRLTNLSVRTTAGTGERTLIVGFAIGGPGGAGTLPLLVRATGPALSAFGVNAVLSDPVLTLFQGETALNSNDNWGSNAAQLTSVGGAVGAFPLTNSASLDAALYNSGIVSGSYTAQVTGNRGAVGVALAEIYDATPSSGGGTMRLTNLSARSQVGTGGDILITGFVIAGDAAKRVLIRGIGPSLSQFGVPGVLADPTLSLLNSSAVVVATNDNWGGGSALSAVFTQVGAFGLAADSKDPALLVSLQPGLYTAQLSGVNGTTGVALVEVYEVP